MRSYTRKYLISGEEILYQGHRHWMVFAHPIFWLIITILFVTQFSYMAKLGIIPFVIMLVTAGASYINFTMTEIAVTNMRVIIKIGWISRQSMETMLQNVASIGVHQGFWGRLFGYGMVVVADTGHVSLAVSMVDDPLAFREAVQAEINKRFPPAPETLTPEEEAKARAEEAESEEA